VSDGIFQTIAGDTRMVFIAKFEGCTARNRAVVLVVFNITKITIVTIQIYMIKKKSVSLVSTFILDFGPLKYSNCTVFFY
jgi:hypothetical protein